MVQSSERMIIEDGFVLLITSKKLGVEVENASASAFPVRQRRTAGSFNSLIKIVFLEETPETSSRGYEASPHSMPRFHPDDLAHSLR